MDSLNKLNFLTNTALNGIKIFYVFNSIWTLKLVTKCQYILNKIPQFAILTWLGVWYTNQTENYTLTY